MAHKNFQHKQHTHAVRKIRYHNKYCVLGNIANTANIKTCRCDTSNIHAIYRVSVNKYNICPIYIQPTLYKFFIKLFTKSLSNIHKTYLVFLNKYNLCRFFCFVLQILEQFLFREAVGKESVLYSGSHINMN